MRVQRSDVGFSIVEVVVAMTIFAVGILAIFQVTDSSFKVATGTTHRARATAIATKVVEETRAMPFDKLADGSTGPWSETVGGSTFDVSRVVSSQTAPGATNPYKAVTVVVQWADGSGGHDLSQTSYVYPAGPSATTTTLGTQSLSVLPAITTVTNLGTSVRLAWNPPSPEHKVQRFVVERALTSNFTGPVWRVTRSEPPTSTGYLINGLAAATTYYFRVGAVASNGTIAWSSGVATATTSVSTSVDCKIASASVTPSTVQRVSPYPSPLSVTPTITVETSGTCTGFTAAYEGPDGSEIVVPLGPSGFSPNVWVAQVSNTGSSTWEIGQYRVEITDSMENERGAASFTVCESGAPCV